MIMRKASGPQRSAAAPRWTTRADSNSKQPRLLLAACSIAIGLTIGAGVTSADETVNIAGTFNGWSTQSSDWRMTQVDDQTFEFSRYWQAGVYEFKFVFGGTWNRHLGSAGGNRLDMPGQDIKLQVEASGHYQITLDVQGKTWHLKQTSPMRVIPILHVRRTSLDTYVLDASRSLYPRNTSATKPSSRFEVRRVGAEQDADLDESKTGVSLERIDANSMRLRIKHEGDYGFELTTGSTPEQTATQHEQHHLGDGFQLTIGESSQRSALLFPLDEFRWGTVVDPRKIDGPMRIEALSPSRSFPVTIPEPLANRRILIVADKRKDDIEIKSSGWQAFVFSPRGAKGLPRSLEIETVDVIGSFNGWRPGALRMQLDADNRYRAVVELPEGVHHYKFLVNGMIYLDDKRGDRRFRVPDGNGGFNSGFLIGDDAKSFGEPEAGKINTAALKHDPSSDRYFSPIASNVARISVRTLANDVKAIDLFFSGHVRYPLRKVESTFGFDYWSVQSAIPTDDNRVRYSFHLSAVGGDKDKGLGEYIFGANGAQMVVVPKDLTPFEVEVPTAHEAPDWAKRATWYQIFPERFRNGDKSNDPPRTVPWSHHWEKPYKPGPDVAKGSPQDFEEKGTFFEYIFDRRYGGDLQGVREKLPYLRDLGVNAIYFNPIFHAESLHKYDASDFRHIDDRFGVAGSIDRLKGETTDPATWQWSDSDKVFLEFLDEAHRMGFKVIIDGVFNHTGRDFWAFQDILKNGKDSPYADWFEIKNWDPLEYEAWDKENGSLPKLKHNEALGLAVPVREHLFAVTRRWMDPNGDGDPSDGIDGWRLDVASDINANFWRDWRTLVKSINPDAYIVAELWQESREWLDGKTFDAVMNYPFARRTLRFVINDKKASTPSRFRDEIAEMYAWYRPQVNYVLQNLYDSHDTDRVASMCMNPDVEYDEANRIQDNGPNYDTSKPTTDAYRKLKMLATIQMTFLGAPMVYYGDEVGMYGADDPSDRKPMLWPDLLPYEDPEERIEPDVFEHYQWMMAIRHTYPALQLGDYEPVHVDDAKRIFAYSRTLGDESILVVLNGGDDAQKLDVPVTWPDGAGVIQLDDRSQCKLVLPGGSDSMARAKIQPRPDRKASNLKVASGRLQGTTLAPRSASIFTIVRTAKTN